MVDTVIRGGTVAGPSGTYEADVAIDGETIAAVGSADALPAADAVVDASGKLVMPGVVDPHVHIDDMFSFDTYETAGRAAALGGTTTFIDFGWQPWVGDLSIWDEPGTPLDGVEYKLEAAENPIVDFGLHCVLVRQEAATLEGIQPVIDAGVTTFKLFTAYEVGMDNGFMSRAMQAIADHDAVAMAHTEDPGVCDDLTDRFIEAGKGAPEWYPRSRPDYAEAMAAEDAARLAVEAGCQYYGVHTTNRKAAEVLAWLQDKYGREQIRFETCTHYTTLDDTIFEEMGHLPMLAPPIRKPDDNEAMFEYLRSGHIDVVSTDHCGYTVESKQVDDWWNSKFGANQLQTSLPVFYDEAVNRRGYPVPFVVRLMCTNPARLFGMPDKGTLEPGTDADIVVFDPEATYTITAEDNGGVADFTLYEGREVTGRVDQTFVRGELVADDGAVVGEPGHGEYVERERPNWDA